MPQVEFAAPTDDDVTALVQGMRTQDVDECRAAGCPDLQRVVVSGIARSTMCWAAWVDGEIAAIFGCAPLGGALDPRGAPWLLGTDLVPKHRRILARYTRPYIARMLAAYPHLINAVHEHNTVSVAWLKHMGFELQPVAPYGPLAEPFRIFEMRA